MEYDLEQIKQEVLSLQMTKDVFKLHCLETYEEFFSFSNQVSLKRESNRHETGISKSAFIKYLSEVPLFISEKVFMAFDKLKKGVLSFEDFFEPLKTLVYGNRKEVLSLIFNIIDINEADQVNTADLNLFLILIHKANEEKKFFSFQQHKVDLDERNQIVNSSTVQGGKIQVTKIIQGVVETSSSTTYTKLVAELYRFLLEFIPIFDVNFEMIQAKANIKQDASNSSFSSFEECLNDDDLLDFKVNDPIVKTEISSSLRQCLTSTQQTSTIDHTTFISSVADANKQQWDKNHSTYGKSNNLTKVMHSNYEVTKSEEKHQCHTSNELTPCFADLQKIVSTFTENENKDKPIYSIVNAVADATIHKKQSPCLTHKDFPGIVFDYEVATFYQKPTINSIRNFSSLKKVFAAIIKNTLYLFESEEDKKKLNYIRKSTLRGCFVKESGNVTKIEDHEYYSITIYYSTGRVDVFFFVDSEEKSSLSKIIRKLISYKNFFENYSLEEEIDKGGFARVYKSKLKNSDELSATKVLNKNDTDLELIKTEADILKVSNHPNIVKYINSFENSSFFFIVMEYLQGGTLDHYLKSINFKLEFKARKQLIRQIVETIIYLHDHMIIHRDLKPGNVLVHSIDKNGFPKIKLIDFGLSKFLLLNESLNFRCGTLQFTAPEILRKERYNSSVDIWSLGVMIFYIYTGRYPITVENQVQRVGEKPTIIIKKKVSPSDATLIGEEAFDLISKCLVTNPKERISIKEIYSHKFFSQ